MHGPEFMKLICAVLYVSWTMGLTRCYETEGIFLHLLRKYKTLVQYLNVIFINLGHSMEYTKNKATDRNK